jgi:uncharacterized protein (DUF1015 family)
MGSWDSDMADVRAFRGVCYNSAKIERLADVITPPYDVISPDQKKQFLERSPYNIVRLILPDGENPYSQSAQLQKQWTEEKILSSDPDPGIYCYHQTFRTPEGEQKTRKGFLALIRLVDFNEGVVLPHEATLSAPKEDRLQLLRYTRTNFCPIFSLYSDPDLKIDQLLEPFTSAPPRVQAVDSEGILNEFWPVYDPDIVAQIEALMKDHWVLIADGHHRYEACLLYRNERSSKDPAPDAPFRFTLMFFCNIDQPGITVLPYNRAVLNLPQYNLDEILGKASEYFNMQTYDDSATARNKLKEAGRTNTAFLASLEGTPSFYLFQLKKNVRLSSFFPPDTPEAVQKLDVNVLHKIFLETILSISEEDIRSQKYLKYYKNEQDEQTDFENRKIQIAFFLNPTRIDQVVEVSKAGRKMPQKSTYFYPKVMTGFVLNQQE